MFLTNAFERLVEAIQACEKGMLNLDDREWLDEEHLKEQWTAADSIRGTFAKILQFLRDELPRLIEAQNRRIGNVAALIAECRRMARAADNAEALRDIAEVERGARKRYGPPPEASDQIEAITAAVEKVAELPDDTLVAMAKSLTAGISFEDCRHLLPADVISAVDRAIGDWDIFEGLGEGLALSLGLQKPFTVAAADMLTPLARQAQDEWWEGRLTESNQHQRMIAALEQLVSQPWANGNGRSAETRPPVPDKPGPATDGPVTLSQIEQFCRTPTAKTIQNRTSECRKRGEPVPVADTSAREAVFRYRELIPWLKARWPELTLPDTYDEFRRELNELRI